ncbi:MAG: hypothetical protein ACPG19_11340 [Saprospiraceae bacterium]
MENQSSSAKELAMLGQIKSILLKDDRAEIDAIKKTLYRKEELAKEVSPIVEERVQYIKDNFRKEFGKPVDRIVEIKLEESKEQLLNVIYPVLGQMIRKFVNYQFQLLKDRIDSQVSSVFSSRGILGQIKSKIFGISSSDMVLSDLDKPIIEEVYVIQRDSGLLLGSFSRKVTVDKDMIAGMLTAIKSFVEDAFQREKQELELIEYGNYKILIQNFFSYYVSVAVSGSLSTKERDMISEKLLEFAENKMPDNLQLIDTELQNQISEGLEAFFNKDIFED